MPKITKETTEKKDNKLASNNISSSGKKKSVTSKSSLKKRTSKTPKKTTSNSNLATSKKTSTKKTPSKKSSTKKISVNKNVKKVTPKIDVLEYYDLPYRYNQTVVKILAQTPKTLFVYWDISDEDRANYIKQYGKNFFENTKPVLIIHNISMGYTFEIEINDFANSWYFNINDEKCEYTVELGRRPKENNNHIELHNNYLYITSSNKIESPNGHILFEKNQKILFYKNVKTNETFSKDIANIRFIKYFGKIYNIYDMYKKIYKEDEFFNIQNPTSNFN